MTRTSLRVSIAAAIILPALLLFGSLLLVSGQRAGNNAALDMLKMKRETHSSGWRFTALLLVKDGVVLYKLSGGQPSIHEIAQTEDILAPVQALSSKLNSINGIEVTDVRNGIKSASSPNPNAGHVEAVTAIGMRH